MNKRGRKYITLILITLAAAVLISIISSVSTYIIRTNSLGGHHEDTSSRNMVVNRQHNASVVQKILSYI